MKNPWKAHTAQPAPSVAYLVNQYPKTSHSFIRREILALEERGLRVERFSIRATQEPLVDERDRQEAERTRVLLEAGAASLVLQSARVALTRPLRWLRALGLAVQMGRRSERGLARHLAYLAEACALLRWLEQLGVSHLHAHFVTNPAAVALLTRTLGGPPFSFRAHGANSFYDPLGNALSEKIQGASCAVAVSDHGRSQLYRLTPPEQWSKIKLARCATDAEFLEADPAPIPEQPRLVCVARLDRAKGHLFLLEAAARLAREGLDFELELVGDGEARAAIETAIEDLELGPRVSLGGWKDGPGVRAAIEAARCLVLPSLDEGLPVVLMEALALGRPVIGTYVGGIPELVRPGENGWLVPAASVEALTEALRAAISLAPGVLSAMGRRGAALVAERHDARREARHLAEIFGFSERPHAA